MNHIDNINSMILTLSIYIIDMKYSYQHHEEKFIYLMSAFYEFQKSDNQTFQLKLI